MIWELCPHWTWQDNSWHRSVYLFFSGVGEDLLRLCLTSLTHSLNQDDCVDHFLSSTYSMQILQMCVTQHNTLLPLVLQVIIILYFVMWFILLLFLPYNLWILLHHLRPLSLNSRYWNLVKITLIGDSRTQIFLIILVVHEIERLGQMDSGHSHRHLNVYSLCPSG